MPLTLCVETHVLKQLMNTNRFQIITPRDLKDYHDLAGEITEVVA